MRNERLSCFYKQCIECILKQQLTAIVPKEPSMKLIKISRIELLNVMTGSIFYGDMKLHMSCCYNSFYSDCLTGYFLLQALCDTPIVQ